MDSVFRTNGTTSHSRRTATPLTRVEVVCPRSVTVEHLTQAALTALGGASVDLIQCNATQQTLFAVRTRQLRVHLGELMAKGFQGTAGQLLSLPLPDAEAIEAELGRMPQKVNGGNGAHPAPHPSLDSLAMLPTKLPEPNENLIFLRDLGPSEKVVLCRLENHEAQCVVTEGENDDQVAEMVQAERIYRAAGLQVPPSKLFRSNKGKVRVAEYVIGTPLHEVLSGHDLAAAKAVLDQLAAKFLLHVVVGNEGLLGRELDRVLVTSDGPVLTSTWGALRYNSEGELKAPAFGSGLGELRRFRDAPGFTNVFGRITPAQLKSGQKWLSTIRDPVLESVSDKSLQAVLNTRFALILR
jgi:hypothetical protein